MKRLFLIFLLLIIALPCFGGQTLKRHLEPETVNYFSLPSSSGDQFTLNEQIKLVKYNGGSVTLSGLVANFSNVAGFQFVTNPSSDLRKWIGYYITFTSSAGNTLKVKVSAAGTGETLSDELLSNGNMETGDPPTGWIPNNAILSAEQTIKHSGNQSMKVVDNGASVNAAQNQASILGALYLFVGYGYLDSTTCGTARLNFLFQSDSVATFDTKNTWVNLTRHMMCKVSNDPIKVASDGGAITNIVYYDDLSLRQVLTPSSSGIYFTDPVVTGTFNYNAASYTAVITKD